MLSMSDAGHTDNCCISLYIEFSSDISGTYTHRPLVFTMIFLQSMCLELPSTPPYYSIFRRACDLTWESGWQVP
jgi:hypothetical protein